MCLNHASSGPDSDSDSDSQPAGNNLAQPPAGLSPGVIIKTSTVIIGLRHYNECGQERSCSRSTALMSLASSSAVKVVCCVPSIRVTCVDRKVLWVHAHINLLCPLRRITNTRGGWAQQRGRSNKKRPSPWQHVPRSALGGQRRRGHEGQRFFRAQVREAGLTCIWMAMHIHPWIRLPIHLVRWERRGGRDRRSGEGVYKWLPWERRMTELTGIGWNTTLV